MTTNELHQARVRCSDRIKKRRLELGMSQEQVAERSGMSRMTIIRAESGREWLHMKPYIMICKALGLEPWEKD